VHGAPAPLVTTPLAATTFVATPFADSRVSLERTRA
jgi:hypothetical protein